MIRFWNFQKAEINSVMLIVNWLSWKIQSIESVCIFTCTQFSILSICPYCDKRQKCVWAIYMHGINRNSVVLSTHEVLRNSSMRRVIPLRKCMWRRLTPFQTFSCQNKSIYNHAIKVCYSRQAYFDLCWFQHDVYCLNRSITKLLKCMSTYWVCVLMYSEAKVMQLFVSVSYTFVLTVIGIHQPIGTRGYNTKTDSLISVNHVYLSVWKSSTSQ